MRTRLFLAAAVLMLMAAFTATAYAGGDTKLNYKGVYTAWVQSQHEFTLGKSDYDDRYVVQMLRLNLDFEALEGVHAITRFDMGQGWWGVDNADRTVNRTGKIGGSSLFDYKDTNFLFHVDQAYITFDLPNAPIQAKVGRMWYGLGNKLLLDNNLDGFQFTIAKKLHVGYAKVSEGSDGLSDIDNSSDDGADMEDADVFTAQLKGKAGDAGYELFGLYYSDKGGDDGTTYMPNDINYFRSRFTPHLSQLTAFGLSGNYKNKDMGLNVVGEFNMLTGKDEVDNTTIDAKQLTDINNGDLSGFNVYLKANKSIGPRFNLGGVFGMGSGDDDLTDGKGNVNKLRTSGFFYITEIWEDSIMPDEEGITPQGLGAPNVRAYRELENSTVMQANANIKLTDKLSLFGSYTMINATQAIPNWMVNNNDTPDDASDDFTEIGDESATDIGTEIDWKLVYKIYPKLVFAFRGGFFTPGDAAGYLINGNTDNAETAWEYKAVITLKF